MAGLDQGLDVGVGLVGTLVEKRGDLEEWERGVGLREVRYEEAGEVA